MRMQLNLVCVSQGGDREMLRKHKSSHNMLC